MNNSTTCCKSENNACHSKRCCISKALGALLVLALVAGTAYCLGSRQVEAKPTAQSGAQLPAQASNDTPVLRP